MRIPESVFSSFVAAFRIAHPRFNYFGPTEYNHEDTLSLCNELTATPWGARESGGLVESGTQDVVRSIIALADQALSKGQSLLVLGP